MSFARATSLGRLAPIGLLLSSLVLLAVGPAAQDEDEREEVERLDAWPALEKEARRSAQTEIQRLRKARTEAMGEQARDALVALGAGAAPLLLPALGKEKGEDARARIVEVLDKITGPPHTRLLAEEFANRSLEVRIWTLRRVALFPDPGVRPAAEAVWSKLRPAAENEKKKRKEPDPRERLAGALAATSSGSCAGLEHLLERSRGGCITRGRGGRPAAEGVRGPEATALLTDRLDGERAETIAALRLLAGCGEREAAVPRVRPFLDAEDAGLRIAAINALRGIVDGDPPVEKLSVFDAIERAKAWKRRL